VRAEMGRRLVFLFVTLSQRRDKNGGGFFRRLDLATRLER